MKRIAEFLCYISFCTLLLSALYFIWRGCFPYGYWLPVIAGEPVIFDIGLVKTDAPISGTFRVKNIGNRPLLIEGIEPVCGSGGFIQVVSFPNITMLRPDETGSIVFSFHPARLQGHVQKKLAIKSNDPLTPIFLLSVRALVDLPPPVIEDRSPTFAPPLAPMLPP
ncbi:MAG: DUF1573 domain-containing protein [Planctomycetaceae bacterium]|jgi:hypothetical protein|nr:DUF1573 domain-containing protein [Planctomycetaceae bacterium]